MWRGTAHKQVFHVFLFIKNGYYKMAAPSKFYTFFNARMLVVHIVVIAGTFIYKFLADKLQMNHMAVMMICVLIFAIVKTMKTKA